MISHLITRLKRIKSPLNLRKKLRTFVKRGLNLIDTPSSRRSFLRGQSFFVLLPIFRFLGDTGLRTTSADISRDEQTHVAANTLVCQALDLKADKTLNNLRRATINWATQSLGAESSHRHLSKNFWLSQSDSLYATGKALGLTDTRASRMPAFFETANQNLPQYA